MSKVVRKIEYVLGAPFNAFQSFRKLKQFHSKQRTIEEIVNMSLTFGGHGYFKVRTMQIYSEIVALARAVESLKPRTILEIGTAYGGTLFIWSHLATERVISCDIENKGLAALLYKSFPPPSSGCRVTLLTGDSHTDAMKEQVAMQLNGKRVDFLFIDGDHSESGVAADYHAYKRFVRPGGIIAFHDIIKKQHLSTNQVYYFWQELKKEVQTEEFIHDPNQTGYGIGIVHVPIG